MLSFGRSGYGMGRLYLCVTTREASGSATSYNVCREIQMPAPQASMMKQLARLKFAGNSKKMPDAWSQPSGDPAGKHYGKAFKADEKTSSPDTTAPPLFTPASLNKYHTDTQKKI